MQLAVSQVAGGSSDILELSTAGAGNVFIVDSAGNVSQSGVHSLGVAADATQLFVNGGSNTVRDVIQAVGASGRGGVQKDGGLFTNLQSAPPDAALFENGRLILWFDSTHGAAKLMVKAKDATGSIVTAAVALA